MNLNLPKIKFQYENGKSISKVKEFPKYNIDINMKKNYCSNILQSVQFDRPISVIDALKSFISNPQIINDFWLLKDHSPRKDLFRLINELQEAESLKDKKTTSMIGCGYSSYVFDIGDNKVLKFTFGDHFNGRKHEFFDLPIQESGKVTENGQHYYYIEEKVSQDNITEYDIKMMESQAGILDYILIDCHSTRQFGRTKDGQIRLIDPECAEKKPNMWYKKLKQKYLAWIYKHIHI
jgi:hypothetical protein